MAINLAMISRESAQNDVDLNLWRKHRSLAIPVRGDSDITNKYPYCFRKTSVLSITWHEYASNQTSKNLRRFYHGL